MTARTPGVSKDAAIGTTLSPRVLAALRKPRLQALFVGRGEPSVGPDGVRYPTTSTGFDRSVAVELAGAGVDDRTEIAAAVLCRPDDAARVRGLDYALTVSDEALRAVGRVAGDGATAPQGEARAKHKAAGVDFIVNAIRIYDAEPPTFEFNVGGHVFRLSADELLNPRRFRARFTEAVGRVPHVPAEDDWHQYVNGWLRKAVHVELPPEASPDGLAREEIERILAELPVGNDSQDVDRDRALLDGGSRLFKLATVRKRLRDASVDVPLPSLARILRDLGCAPEQLRIGGRPVRVWRRLDQAAPTLDTPPGRANVPADPAAEPSVDVAPVTSEKPDAPSR